MTDTRVERACDGCGLLLVSPSVEDYPAVFLAHVRSAHLDWPYDDEAVLTVGAAMLRLTGSVEWLSDIGPIEVHAVDGPGRVDDWLALFDHDLFVDRPWLASCYCLEPHQPIDAPSQSEWEERRARMISLFGKGEAFGYLAYAKGRPVGWVNAAARAHQALHARGPDSDPPNDQVAAVACFAVAPPYRRHRISERLLDAVVEGAPGRGLSWVEGYPIKAGEGAAQDPLAGSFRGSRVLFESRGFELVKERARDLVFRRPV